MGFLSNLFKSGDSSEDFTIDSLKSFFINDMEKKWKMHVEKDLKSNGKNVISYLYAIQTLKYRGRPDHLIEAEKIQDTKMANGLIPLIKSGKLNIELTSFLEVYIYFYNNNTIGFLSSIVEGDSDKIITTIDTDMKNAKENYKTFIEDTHKKTFNKNKLEIKDIEKMALNGNLDCTILLAQDSISDSCTLKDSYSQNEAIKWNKLAAEQGDADSQLNYALLKLRNLKFINDNTLDSSARKDLDEALFWAKKAASQNVEDAKETVNDLERIIQSIN